MAVVFLDGKKVYLRPLERSDADQLLVWVNDPEVTRTLLLYRPISQAVEVEFIDRVNSSKQDVALGIVAKSVDRLIGVVSLTGIDFRNRHAQFGVFIGDKAQWGRGYGTEATRLMTGFAFRTLNLHRVWLHVTADNTAGIRAYEKSGFKREGLLRQAHYKEGRYHDLVAMAILREEFAAAC